MPEAGEAVATLETGSSHLYPGATGSIAGCHDRPADCLVIFSDGSSAGGRLAPTGDGALRLDLGAYRTARGSGIAAKAWRIAPLPGGRFRVTARLDAPQLSRRGGPPTTHP